MIWFWILFWWIALSFPIGVLAGKMLRRAAEQQTQELPDDFLEVLRGDS